MLDHHELLLSADAVHHGPWYSRITIIWQLLFVAMMMLAIGAYKLNQVNAARGESSMTLALEGPPPAVEPLILRQVAPDEAVKINAAVPFTTASITAARSFQLAGGGDEVSRATDCLASAIYYEAANESVEGQMAVAQVVLNRVRHPAFPKSVCGVVYQGQERSTGCQFSFTCDGSMARHPSPETWERMRALARSMLGGAVYAPVGLATHYHADYVVPYWSAALDKIQQVGRHIFYTWSGAWGSKAAFRARYAGVEPGEVKLAGLSPAHLGAAGGLMGLDPATLSDGVTGPVPSSSSISEGAGGQFILKIDAGVDPALLPNLAAQTCGTRDYCKLVAWTNSASAPKSFPVGDAQMASAGYSYLRDRTAGFDKSLWNCALFPRPDRKQCMKRRVMLEGKVEELIPAEAELLPEAPVAKAEPKVGPLPAPPQSTGRRRPGEG
jgi:Cell Wall Hydrolase